MNTRTQPASKRDRFFHGEPVNGGGLPYKTWDRLGRDLLLGLVLMLCSGALTGVGYLVTAINDIKVSVSNISEKIEGVAKASRRNQDDIKAHESLSGHPGMREKVATVEERARSLTRSIERLESSNGRVR